jgi:NAD(P) transhydrogenase
MSGNHFDVIVIGTGPGGEGAAMKAAKEGKRVAVAEKYVDVGGGCTHWGTIPSKALRHAVSSIATMNSNPLFRDFSTHQQPFTFAKILKTAASVIQRQVQQRTAFYTRNRVTLFKGNAKFVDAHTLTVEQPNGIVDTYTSDDFVIATGSSPYHPADIDFRHPRVFDSDTILRLQDTPMHMTIYGAGVIGCEYASIFRGLGVKVDLINTRDRLLSFLDDEITDALSYHLRELGVLIRHNETYERIEPKEDHVIVHLKSGKKIKTDLFLWANGRAGNTRNLGLENVGIEPNARGNLDVDNNYRTSQTHIYAVGDVIGFPSLASAAYDQGRFASTAIVQGHSELSLASDIPTGIYTIPEISSVGRTERELTQAKVPYEVGHAFFKHLARAQITGQTMGMLKILFHRETLEILGIHCFGDQASEIVHIGQAIMSQPSGANTMMYFINTTFNYPTMAEAYRVAALNGLNRVTL